MKREDDDTTAVRDRTFPGTGSLPTRASERQARRGRIGFVWAGVIAGTVGIFCCVGPVLLALVALLSPREAFEVSTYLYDTWAWAFRAAGLLTLAAILGFALRRHGMLTLRGIRSSWQRIALALAIGIVTYITLYWATTALGTLV